jgi:hypothetical protein
MPSPHVTPPELEPSAAVSVSVDDDSLLPVAALLVEEPVEDGSPLLGVAVTEVSESTVVPPVDEASPPVDASPENVDVPTVASSPHATASRRSSIEARVGPTVRNVLVHITPVSWCHDRDHRCRPGYTCTPQRNAYGLP